MNQGCLVGKEAEDWDETNVYHQCQICQTALVVQDNTNGEWKTILEFRFPHAVKAN